MNTIKNYKRTWCERVTAGCIRQRRMWTRKPCCYQDHSAAIPEARQDQLTNQRHIRLKRVKRRCWLRIRREKGWNTVEKAVLLYRSQCSCPHFFIFLSYSFTRLIDRLVGIFPVCGLNFTHSTAFSSTFLPLYYVFLVIFSHNSFPQAHLCV